MNESSIMLLAGPGSAYGGNEFRGELDDNYPTMDLVKSSTVTVTRRANLRGLITQLWFCSKNFGLITHFVAKLKLEVLHGEMIRDGMCMKLDKHRLPQR